MKVVLVVDEASLLRLEVFAELHTLTQFEQDSKPWLPIVLAGQANLVENLQYRTSMPLANRVVAKSHLKGDDQETMTEYLKHHLARGALIAAAKTDSAASMQTMSVLPQPNCYNQERKPYEYLRRATP